MSDTTTSNNERVGDLVAASVGLDGHHARDGRGVVILLASEPERSFGTPEQQLGSEVSRDGPGLVEPRLLADETSAFGVVVLGPPVPCKTLLRHRDGGLRQVRAVHLDARHGELPEQDWPGASVVVGPSAAQNQSHTRIREQTVQR